MKAVSYSRYSSEMQNEDSIEAQLREIYKYAGDHKIQVIHDYIDQEKSGKYDTRPEFQQMIHDAKKGLFDLIILHKIDRFARNRYDSAIYKAQLKRSGVKIIYAAQNIADNPEGRLMEGILESFAEYYSDNLATEVMKGLKTVALRGEFTGGYAPLGYDIVDKKYTVNEVEAPIVKAIFNMYAVGKSYCEIIKTCKDKGWKTKFNADFGKNSLYSILKNEKYIGTMIFNKAVPRIPGKRNGHKTKPEDQFIVKPDVIPEIIDKDTWRKVQLRQADNKRKGQYKAKELYLLSGLIYCHCGSKMFGNRVSNAQKKYYTYYECKACGKKTSKDKIENNAIETLLNDIFSDEQITKYVERLSQHIKNKESSKSNDISKFKTGIKKMETEINNIVSAISRGVSSQSLEERLSILESAKKDLAFQLATLQLETIVKPLSVNNIHEKLKLYKINLQNKNLAECRIFISKFILSATFKNDKIEYIYSLDSVGADKLAPVVSKHISIL